MAFTFHPIEAVLLYCVIADQSNWSLDIFPCMASQRLSESGPVWISSLFLGYLTLTLLHDGELREGPTAFPSFAGYDKPLCV